DGCIQQVAKAQVEVHARADFLQYSRQITLDPNTANQFLVLSEGNRKVTHNNKNKPSPDHPDRFIQAPQVLSKDRLTGRCYWEVEISGTVGVAVAYRNISQSGASPALMFGYNDKSWVLYCSNSYAFMHNNTTAFISGPQSTRIGVYLDYSAGVLSFYSVSETMTLLHSVKTTFTQPLYGGVFLSSPNGNTAELCELK
uniref:Tripartite motif-containing protein 16-like n=1 Tax=Mastacembelus armatus TaxID=205130 RepID=A0A7N8WP59_9TELE